MPTTYSNPDDCKSALGKKMQKWRSERPSEWIMDEFIREAEALSSKVKKLEFMVENGLGLEDMKSEV